MYGSEDSFGPTAVGELANVAVQYLMGSWLKKSPNSKYALLTELGVAAVGTGLKNHTRHPYMSASLEASGSGAVGALGLAIASSTNTMGGIVAGSIPMNISGTTASLVRRVNYSQPGRVIPQPIPAPQVAWSPMYTFGAG